jgi:hypothetical protein
MLMSFLQAFLPGVRDVRTPFVAGLIWLLFGWLLLADLVPNRVDATGFVRQVFEISGWLGGSVVVAVFSVCAYVAGILGVTFAHVLRSVLVTVASQPLRWLRTHARFQLLARQKRGQTRRAIRATTAKGEDPKNLVAEIETFKRNERFAGLWIRFTTESLNLVGPRRVHDEVTIEDASDMAERALTAAFDKGAVEELRQRGAEVSHADLKSAYVWDLVEEVLVQLRHDPLDVLRASDEGLYQSFDRERSEREFRVAVMPPVVATCTYLAVLLSPWAWLGVVLASATFVQASTAESREGWRVLNQLVLKGFPSSSLSAARTRGKIAVRDHLAKRAATSAAPPAPTK